MDIRLEYFSTNNLYILKNFNIQFNIPFNITDNVLIIFNSNNIIGYSIISYDNELRHLYIDKNFRGIGLGKYLLNMTINIFPELYLYVNKDNEIAINLYKSFKFKIIYNHRNYYIMKN